MSINNKPSQTAASFLVTTKAELAEFSFEDQNHILIDLVKAIRKERANAIQAQEEGLKEMKKGYNELDSLMQDEIVPQKIPDDPSEELPKKQE